MDVNHHVRRAGLDDVPHLVALMVDFYSESDYALDPAAAARAFERLLANEELGRVWLADADGETAGYVVLTLGYSMEYGGRDAFVDDLYVRPDHRRTGVGKALLAELLRECETLGVHALHLEVDRDNAPAQALYAAQGFRDNHRQLLTLRLEDPLHFVSQRDRA